MFFNGFVKKSFIHDNFDELFPPDSIVSCDIGGYKEVSAASNIKDRVDDGNDKVIVCNVIEQTVDGLLRHRRVKIDKEDWGDIAMSDVYPSDVVSLHVDGDELKNVRFPSWLKMEQEGIVSAIAGDDHGATHVKLGGKWNDVDPAILETELRLAKRDDQGRIIR